MSAEALIQKMTDTDDQSYLCVVLRKTNDRLEVALVADEIGRWSIPGGHANGAESGVESCKREVREETGMDVDPQPLFLASHAARKLPVTLYYAIVEPNTKAKPGGGDVTKVEWTPVNALGSLNGTDRLAIAAAASRVHDVGGIVEELIEEAEALGYPTSNVLQAPDAVYGHHIRLTGAAAPAFAKRLAENLPKAASITAKIFESTSSALERAHNRRQLTPVLECLLRVSDAMWRYESLILPALKENRHVLEAGADIDWDALRLRGVPLDILDHLRSKMPVAALTLDVGDAFDAATYTKLKEAVYRSGLLEDIDDPSERDIENIDVRTLEVPHRLEFVEPDVDGGVSFPIVRCPACGETGSLLNDFSYLRAGFDGIEAGDPDDLDCYECPNGHKLEYRHLDSTPTYPCENCGKLISHDDIETGSHRCEVPSNQQ